MAQRDSGATKREILKAVGRVLEREGFRGLGINAIAKEAGVGKPLIYRYFGGLPQLLEEFGHDADFWLGLDELLAETERETGGVHPTTYGDTMRIVLLCYARILRRRPMMQELLASELTAPAELIEPLAKARRDRAFEALLDFMGDIKPDEGVDANAIFGLLLAGVQYLTLRSRISDDYWGVPLQTDEDWARYEKAINHVASQVFEGKQKSNK